MEKNIHSIHRMKKLATQCLLVLLVFSTTPLLAQNTINLPDCNNCDTNSGVSTAAFDAGGGCYGCFQYKVIDFDGDDWSNNTGIQMLITENGKVFVWGEPYFDQVIYDPPADGYYDYPPSPGELLASAIRYDMPSGVKATKCSMGGMHLMVIGDDGLLYGMGNPSASNVGTSGAGAWAGSSVNNNSFSPITMPPGATSIVDVVASDSYLGATMVLDDLGKVWFTGVYDSSPYVSYTTWQQVTEAASGVTYTNIWLVNQDIELSNSPFFAAFLEGSDGNYYAFGHNAYWALGNTGLQGETTSGGGTGTPPSGTFSFTPPTSTPLKVELPTGAVVKKFAGNFGRTFALLTDGRLFAWGSTSSASTANSHLKVPLVSGASGNIKLPEEVALPTGNTIPVYPTSTGFLNMDDNGRRFQCNDGGLYYETTTIGFRNVIASGGGTVLDRYTHTGNGFKRYLGFMHEYVAMGIRWGLTSSGHVVEFDATTQNYSQHPYTIKSFLQDPRFDITNPRPTE